MRAKKTKIIDLINSNAYQWVSRKGKIYKPIFLTLTFAKNIIDLDYANNEFKNFIKRLSYDIKGLKLFISQISSQWLNFKNEGRFTIT